jgi:hypothetical protein
MTALELVPEFAIAKAPDRLVALSKASIAGREAIVLKKLLRVVIAILVSVENHSQRFPKRRASHTTPT